jgi:hypothetical protein
MEVAQLTIKELRTRDTYTIQELPDNCYGCGTWYIMVREGKCAKAGGHI